jgi:hypothetical protein
VGLESSVDPTGEQREWQRVVALPGPGKEMVIKHIHQYPPAVAERVVYPQPAPAHRGMVMGEAVHPAVDHDPPGDVRRIGGVDSPLDEIAKEAPHQFSRSIVGKVEMEEVVHAGSLSASF